MFQKICGIVTRCDRQKSSIKSAGCRVDLCNHAERHVPLSDACLEGQAHLHAILKTAVQERHNDGKMGSLDGLHKGGSCEAVDAVVKVGRLGHALHELGHEGLDIVVAADFADIACGGEGSVSDGGLGVVHAWRHGWDDGRHFLLDLLWAALGEGANHLEGEDLRLPLLGKGQRGKELGHDLAHGDGGNQFGDDVLHSLGGGVADEGLLVSGQIETPRKGGDYVWLHAISKRL